MQACNHSGQAGQLNCTPCMTLVTIFTYILAHVLRAGGQPLGRDHCGVHFVQRPRATNSHRRRVEVSRCLGRGRVWRLRRFRVHSSSSSYYNYSTFDVFCGGVPSLHCHFMLESSFILHKLNINLNPFDRRAIPGSQTGGTCVRHRQPPPPSPSITNHKASLDNSAR